MVHTIHGGMWKDGATAYGKDTGGGYINSPGYGSTQQASQQKARVRSNIPCTVAQIMRAEVIDDAFVCDNITYHQVTLVGIVRSAKESATNLAYEIDDMSGPLIEVRQFGDNDENTPEAERLSLIRENIYVRVHGHLRSFGNKRSIIAFKVRALADMNELTMHLLEVLCVRARSKRSDQSSAMKPISNMGLSHAGVTSMDMSSDAGLTMPQKQVLDIFRMCPNNEGYNIRMVHEKLPGMPDRVFKEVVEFLSNEGHIYSTIDDMHYKAIDGASY